MSHEEGMTQGERITTTISTTKLLQTDKTNAPQSTQSIAPHVYLLYFSLTSPSSSKLESHASKRQTPDYSSLVWSVSYFRIMV